MQQTILRILVSALALAGLADALYFTLAYYGRVRKARWVPEVLCAREDSSCVTVVKTPYGRVFGVPNSLLGIVYYAGTIAGAAEGWGFGVNWEFHWAGRAIPWGLGVMTLAAAATVLLGIYLIYALRRKLHVHCPLCYTAHAINAALLVLLVMLAWSLRRLP